jgi:hypothetical protein
MKYSLLPTRYCRKAWKTRAFCNCTQEMTYLQALTRNNQKNPAKTVVFRCGHGTLPFLRLRPGKRQGKIPLPTSAKRLGASPSTLKRHVQASQRPPVGKAKARPVPLYRQGCVAGCPASHHVLLAALHSCWTAPIQSSSILNDERRHRSTHGVKEGVLP